MDVFKKGRLHPRLPPLWRYSMFCLVRDPPASWSSSNGILPLQGLPRLLGICYFDGTIILLTTLIYVHCWKLAACFVHNNFLAWNSARMFGWFISKLIMSQIRKTTTGNSGFGIVHTSMERSVLQIQVKVAFLKWYNIHKRSMIYGDRTLIQ